MLAGQDLEILCVASESNLEDIHHVTPDHLCYWSLLQLKLRNKRRKGGRENRKQPSKNENCPLATRQPRPACLRNLHQFPSSSINLPPELRSFTTNIKHEPCLWPRPASYVRADERTSSTQRDETAGRPELLTTYRIGS